MKQFIAVVALVVSFFVPFAVSAQTDAPACIGFLAVHADGQWYGNGSVDGIDAVAINLVYTAKHEAIAFASQQRGVTLLTAIVWEQQYAAFLQ